MPEPWETLDSDDISAITMSLLTRKDWLVKAYDDDPPGREYYMAEYWQVMKTYYKLVPSAVGRVS